MTKVDFITAGERNMLTDPDRTCDLNDFYELVKRFRVEWAWRADRQTKAVHEQRVGVG